MTTGDYSQVVYPYKYKGLFLLHYGYGKLTTGRDFKGTFSIKIQNRALAVVVKSSHPGFDPILPVRAPCTAGRTEWNRPSLVSRRRRSLTRTFS